MQDLEECCKLYSNAHAMACGGIVDCLPHRTRLAHLSDRYQRLVLRGESPQPKDLEVAPRLKDLKVGSITIANHLYGAVLIFTDSHHDKFELIMRCLANRRDIGARA
jgi:hypothetical protein